MNLNMAIEIVGCPINSMVIFYTHICFFNRRSVCVLKEYQTISRLETCWNSTRLGFSSACKSIASLINLAGGTQISYTRARIDRIDMPRKRRPSCRHFTQSKKNPARGAHGSTQLAIFGMENHPFFGRVANFETHPTQQ